MPKYQRKPDGARYHPSYGRVMEHHGYSLHIFWSAQMIDYLRRHFPVTLNEELAGCLGVSVRTMIRKARELGMKKDPQWLASVWSENRLLAHSVSKRRGYPGGFKKGQHANPEGEFKTGEAHSEETKRKRVESLKRWYKRHPKEARAKAIKAWETRRAKINKVYSVCK